LGIERWLYERLRRPSITIVGSVFADLSASQPRIDWISAGKAKPEKDSSPMIARVFVRGGCEMQAIAHYFALDAEQLETEFPFDRGGLSVPIHHSAVLRAAIQGISETQIEAALTLGYEAIDFRSRALDRTPPFDLYAYSFWADSHYPLYRDRTTSLCLPFGIHGLNNSTDLRQIDAEALRAKLPDRSAQKRLEVLRQRFDYLSWTPGIYVTSDETLFQQNLRIIFNACPPKARIFVLLGCERIFDAAGQPRPLPHLMELNRITRRAAEDLPHVHLLAPDDFISVPSDVIDATHFDRRVYFRIYQRIVEICRMTNFD